MAPENANDIVSYLYCLNVVNMHLNEINIKNFKGFADATFSFADPFTVVVGDNAAGKTALLDAVAVAIGGWLGDFGHPNARGIGKDEIRRISPSLFSVEPVFPVEITPKLVWKQSEYFWQRVLSTRRGSTKTIWEIPSKQAFKQSFQLVNAENTPVMPFPVFTYHGTGRLWAEHTSAKYAINGSRYEAYDNALSPKASSRSFLAWYKTMDDEWGKFEQPEAKLLLDAFKEAIITMVPNWQDMAFSRAENDLMGKTGKDGKVEWTPFRLLSDGYRNLIGMVADIAWRCIKLNGHLLREAVRASEGIVLIDELDLHLHPKWQQSVVRDLQSAFPKLQFIVTTHSPFIVQSLRAEQLINLDGIAPAADPNKRSLSETALLMGVPSAKSVVFNEQMDLAGDFYERLNNPEATELEIQELVTKAEDNFSDDPAFIAKMKFEKLAKMGS
jgi:predicted ATP-binding protein involved in virulence